LPRSTFSCGGGARGPWKVAKRNDALALMEATSAT